MHPSPKFNNMKGNIYLILLALLFITFESYANRTIQGTVIDANNLQVLPGVSVIVKGTKISTLTDINGQYSIIVPNATNVLVFSFIGFKTQEASLGKSNVLNIKLALESKILSEVVVVGYSTPKRKSITASVASVRSFDAKDVNLNLSFNSYPSQFSGTAESYKHINENGFQSPKEEALSTFAIDVDNASYSNFRRFINNGTLPPADAVRIEEMINYFKYDLKSPEGNEPVAIQSELSVAPWNTKHQLLRVALKARDVEKDKLPPSNLVFLIDVSGSMAPYNRLPLVKSSLKMLVEQLREKDKVAIVTYAGGADIKLTSTSGNEKSKINAVIDQLNAGGGTAGGAGLKMAYQVARENFIKKGNNRIILATDGDFNIGASSDEDMEHLIVHERESGINISVLGYGMGNLQDSKMELIADKGRGNYAYIDNITEARKAMVTEFGGTLFTVAKDVKVQVEFNPGKVQAYRLIGYENRLMAKEDFNNDRKIGGDMGVGHVVTALYEIIPAGIKSNFAPNVDPLKYQQEEETKSSGNSSEIATVKFRYKDPEGEESRLQKLVIDDKPIALANTSNDFRFASAVAELGMLIRDSEFKQKSDFEKLIARAKDARGKDEDGYRAEFVRLAESAKSLKPNLELAVE